MHALDHHDLGTPAVDASEVVSLEIDGVAVTVPGGTSLLRAAGLAGITVPKLCATDTLRAFGSCRLCLVEIEGRGGYPASCTTAAASGMKVRTQSTALTRLRRGVVELYVSDHPLDCGPCAANGHCELQDVAAAVGVERSPYPAGACHAAAPRDASNPYFSFDPALCVGCSRCVRACDEVQGTLSLTVAGRGFESRIAASHGGTFL